MISGYYYKPLKTQSLPSETCLECGTQGGVVLEVGCRVHHWMFIPMWANKKCVTLTCEVCSSRHVVPENSPVSDIAFSMYEKTRYRWYHYALTFFLITVIASTVILIFSGEKENKDELLSEIENINADDVIYYRLNNKEKTSMYVDTVINDTVFVRENRLSTNKSVSTIDLEHNYTDKQSFYLKSTLLEMYEQKKIINIYQSKIQLTYEDF